MKNRVVVVVDYQQDFVGGSLGFEAAVSMDEELAKHIKEERSKGSIIVATLDTHNENYLNTQEGTRLPIIHTVDGTPGHELYGLTGEEIKSQVYFEIKKETFGSTELMRLLQRINSKEIQISEVEFCGVVTNMCVISNAIAAKMTLPEVRIIVNAKLCASNDSELHQKALDVMKSMQIDIINEDETRAETYTENTKGQELYKLATKSKEKLEAKQVESAYNYIVLELRKEAVKGHFNSAIGINNYDTLLDTKGRAIKWLIGKLKEEGIKAVPEVHPGGEYGEDTVYMRCEITNGK